MADPTEGSRTRNEPPETARIRIKSCVIRQKPLKKARIFAYVRLYSLRKTGGACAWPSCGVRNPPRDLGGYVRKSRLVKNRPVKTEDSEKGRSKKPESTPLYAFERLKRGGGPPFADDLLWRAGVKCGERSGAQGTARPTSEGRANPHQVGRFG